MYLTPSYYTVWAAYLTIDTHEDWKYFQATMQILLSSYDAPNRLSPSPCPSHFPRQHPEKTRLEFLEISILRYPFSVLQFPVLWTMAANDRKQLFATKNRLPITYLKKTTTYPTISSS